MTDPLADVMRGLRREYLGGAPKRLEELREFLAGVEQGDAAALDGLRRALHKLAGSGGSYGFDAISSTSRSAEHMAKALQDRGGAVTGSDLGALRDSVVAVETATHAAIAADKGGQG